MKKYILFNLILSILLTLSPEIYSQNGWVVQNPGTTNNLWSIKFIDEHTGYICGQSGLLLKTTNAGKNWIINYLGSDDLIGMDFINHQTGWVTGHHGAIFKTTNGGMNWFSQSSNTSANLFFPNFVNPNTGFISSDAGVMKTTNGGTSWYFSYLSESPVYAVYFINENYGWFGNNYGNQFLSTNGGLYWLYTQNINNNANISYYFINQSTGWASGYNNKIIKTTNGGYSWEIQYSDPGYGKQLREVEFINNSVENGWAVGFYNTVVKTNNGGINWVLQPMPVNAHYTSIEFINYSTGWIAGNDGLLLKTTNGGTTDINPVNNFVPDKFDLSQNYPNPFNPSTNIIFSLSVSAITSLKIYDVTGKEVAVLINEFINKGNYQIGFNASEFSSGIYFYKLTSGDFVKTKKMTLTK